jgi:putative N6-adenine-specific DNA methylase
VAWILSYREECFDQIGLKPSIKIPLYNGSLECEFRKYSLFDGRMKEFRAEGGIVKTEREKQEMAQKHRFKANREFKTRLEEESNNEEGDIRSFTFHKHEIGDFAGGRKRIDHDEKRGGFGGRRDDKRGGYGDRHDDKRGGFGGRRDDKRGSYGDRHDDKRGGYGDKRGGKKFEGKKFGSNDRRGSFDKRRNHSDSED